MPPFLIKGSKEVIGNLGCLLSSVLMMLLILVDVRRAFYPQSELLSKKMTIRVLPLGDNDFTQSARVVIALLVALVSVGFTRPTAPPPL